MRSHVSCFVLALLITSMLTAALKIQPVNASGTIYIKADGSLDPPTAPISTIDNVTYTLTGNITADTDGIVIERDNIVVDGAGYTLTGSVNGNGATLTEGSNVTVRNMTMENFTCGIWLASSSNSTLSGNNVTANTFGAIGLDNSSNNTLTGNNVTNNAYGIYFDSSPNNTLSGNNISGNEWAGISLYSSPNNVLSANTVEGSQYNLIISGGTLNDYLHSIDTSNLVDSKPVYYLVNKSDMVVDTDTYPKVGYLGFVNCVNVTVQGLNLTGNGDGLLLASTNNSKITGNNVTNNECGIRLCWYSNNNTLSSNNVTNNGDGIDLWRYSSYNTLSGNNVINNEGNGIELSESSYNTLSGNNVANNGNGIGLDGSPHNTLSGNNVTNNGNGISLFFALHNTLSGNNVTNNGNGIVFFGTPFHSHNNSVTENNIANNRIGIDLSGYPAIHGNRIFHNNFLNNTEQVSNSSVNVWDDDYPSGGNYWSDYNGADSDQDGIGDTPYFMDENNQDDFPLIGMFSDHCVDWADTTYHVTTICNSTIIDFSFGVLAVYPDHVPGPPWTTSIILNVTGDELGFCRIMIPKDALDGEYNVIFDGFTMPPSMWRELPISNDTILYLSLNYTSGFHTIWIMGTTIIPEFPSFLLLPLIFAATSLVVIAYRRKHR